VNVFQKQNWDFEFKRRLFCSRRLNRKLNFPRRRDRLNVPVLAALSSPPRTRPVVNCRSVHIASGRLVDANIRLPENRWPRSVSTVTELLGDGNVSKTSAASQGFRGRHWSNANVALWKAFKKNDENVVGTGKKPVYENNRRFTKSSSPTDLETFTDRKVLPRYAIQCLSLFYWFRRTRSGLQSGIRFVVMAGVYVVVVTVRPRLRCVCT